MSNVRSKPTESGGEAKDRLAITLQLDEPVTRVKLVSPVRSRILAKLGIKTVRDLVTHFPRRYIDMSSVATVATARIGSACTIAGHVHRIQLKRPKRVPLVEITLVDETGTLMVTMFRQPWLMDKVKPGMRLAVAGKLEFDYGFKRMTNPHLEVLEAGEQTTGVIIPVHPATEKISSTMMRRLVLNALEIERGVLDPLPLEVRLRYRLMGKTAALSCIHFPRTMDEQHEARRRLVYEELLLLQIELMREGDKRSIGRTPCAHVIDGPYLTALAACVPFDLTDEQKQARDEILQVMAQPKTANHMLLGDVGTGKTVVAAHALAAAVDSQGQAALMAPTEILARQHAASVGALLDAADISWDILTGSTSAEDRSRIVAGVADGSIKVLLGTHALLEDDVVFSNMTLAVIDEQQRFGVDQRAALLAKGSCPDALFLTATPIPRTLALSLFGNLTLSYIKQRPHATGGRTTAVHTKQMRGEAYDSALAALARGEQVYVVCPLIGKPATKSQEGADDEEHDDYEFGSICIEDEDDLRDEDLSAATAHARFLQQKTFVDYNVELLHGKMPAAEKQAVMDRFVAGETQVLVATTVIEVGVNVPNATVMIIEDADRFGLAQLHQLRGRVGRGTIKGEVHLVSSSKAPVALERLKAMEHTDDGFELSAYDLSLRREGDILGNRQHGASGLKLVNIMRDGAVIEAAHEDARRILDEDPELSLPEHRALAREARIVFKTASEVSGG